MNVKQLTNYLNFYEDDLEIRFIKYPSEKSLAFWDFHEWYICEKKFENGPPNQKFLAILVEDDDK